MDWRISSLGLIFDGLSFLSPLGLGMMGLAWYSDESFAVQAIMVSTGLFLTVVGLLKHGRMSVASSEVLMLACGFLVFLVWYEFGAIAMASTPFGDRCAEFGDPASCNMVSTVNLIESLFWPAVLAPAITFVGLALELGASCRQLKNSAESFIIDSLFVRATDQVLNYLEVYEPDKDLGFGFH